MRIDWTAKAEGASGLAALASVEAQQQVRVEEAALRTHARLTYSISRAELSVLTVEVPADQKVVNVAEANVRQWSVETTGKTQKITVQLFEPARQTGIDRHRPGAICRSARGEAKAAANAPAESRRAAKADAAKPADANVDAPRRTLDVPVVKALNVIAAARRRGGRRGRRLQVEPHSREGLSQLDAADLPPALAKQPHELSYRYAGLPFQLSLDVVKIKPRSGR